MVRFGVRQHARAESFSSVLVQRLGHLSFARDRQTQSRAQYRCPDGNAAPGEFEGRYGTVSGKDALWDSRVLLRRGASRLMAGLPPESRDSELMRRGQSPPPSFEELALDIVRTELNRAIDRGAGLGYPPRALQQVGPHRVAQVVAVECQAVERAQSGFGPAELGEGRRAVQRNDWCRRQDEQLVVVWLVCHRVSRVRLTVALSRGARTSAAPTAPARC